MSENWSEQDKDNYFAPGSPDVDDIPPYDDATETDYATQPEYTLFDAPDYALFVRHKQTARGKEYEQKVASMLKAAALGAFKTGNINDGCAILHYGPSFAKRCGDLTDVSQTAAKAVDFLTTPDNPWVMFGIIGASFGMQLFRNHEQDAKVVKQSWREARAERKRMKAEGLIPPKSERSGKPITVKLPFIGRTLTVNIKLPTPKLITNIFYAQTKHPMELSNKVLSDQKLIRALEKEGIHLIKKRNPNAN